MMLPAIPESQEHESIMAERTTDDGVKIHPPLASISESLGWYFPKVKLASWDPEDEKQWANGGNAIAHRNLLASIPNLFCSLGVWLVWSIITSKIQLMHDKDPNVYPFHDWGSPQGSDYNVLLYTLPAVAALTGGTMRVVNSFLAPIVGGRNVVFHSSIMVAIAMMLTAEALKFNDVPFNFLLVAAWLSGTGGGAFASSMSNMSTLFPKSHQGYALGMNGGLGNLGVSASQLLVPLFMARSFGKKPLSDAVDGWPNHAAWFWWPLCLLCAAAAFVWMSIHPNHGCNDKLWNVIYFYWFESMGLLVSSIPVILLIVTHDISFFVTPGGNMAHSFLLVAVSLVLVHLALRFLSPTSTRESLKQQAKMFNDKHMYIMTLMYTMSFGSFIGFSGVFPKLITDLFGYITAEGCHYTGEAAVFQQQFIDASSTADSGIISTFFIKGGTEFDCVANDGIWGQETVTNPNAPDVFAFAWIGAAVGSVIRPVGGMLADRHGGAKLTQILIMWCTVSTICLAVLVQKTLERKDHPERNFGLFVFLFLNLFFSTGAMNGTVFRTIGVLFESNLAGSVLGWISAFASFGAFVIPAMFGVGFSVGRPENTFYCLAAYYVFCGVINFYFYGRPNAERSGV